MFSGPIGFVNNDKKKMGNIVLHLLLSDFYQLASAFSPETAHRVLLPHLPIIDHAGHDILGSDFIQNLP